MSQRAIRRKIIITGASSGLGEGMAEAFGAQGRELGLCARRTERLDALAARLPAGAAHPAALDVTDPEAVTRVFGQLQERLGGVDRVIVNAGIGQGTPLGTGKPGPNRGTLTTNVLGALNQCEAALEIFRGQGYGHLVLISSMIAVQPLPGAAAAYSASKAAVDSLGRSLQLELGRGPIVVTRIQPGFVKTELTAGMKNPLLVGRERGVAAIVKAIEAERRRAPVPAWPWRPLDLALRVLPDRLIGKVV